MMTEAESNTVEPGEMLCSCNELEGSITYWRFIRRAVRKDGDDKRDRYGNLRLFDWDRFEQIEPPPQPDPPGYIRWYPADSRSWSSLHRTEHDAIQECLQRRRVTLANLAKSHCRVQGNIDSLEAALGRHLVIA